MSDPTTYLLLLLLVVIGSTSLAGVAWLCRVVRLTAAQCAELRADIEGLAATTRQLAGGNPEVEQLLGDLSRRTRTMENRQDRIEMRNLDERRYSEAARLVQQGADSKNLVRNCGLTSGEADLLVRLHGARRSA